MKSKGIVTIAFCVLGSTFPVGQGQAPNLPPAPANPPAPSLQSAADPGYAALIAQCKTQPPARGGRGGGGARGAQPQGPRDYSVTEIPGVIAAGQQWKFLWQEAGNNGDEDDADEQSHVNPVVGVGVQRFGCPDDGVHWNTTMARTP